MTQKQFRFYTICEYSNIVPTMKQELRIEVIYGNVSKQ